MRPTTGGVVAYGGAGDTAYLYDAPGSNTFVSTPSYAYLSGSGFLSESVGFSTVVAEGTPGNTDTASLFDAPGSNTFVSTPSYAYLSGSGFLSEAMGFKIVIAEATQGSADFAYLYAPAYLIGNWRRVR